MRIQEERIKILNFQISHIERKIKNLSTYSQATRGHKYASLSKKIDDLSLLGLNDTKINELKEMLEITYQSIVSDRFEASSS